VAGDDTEGIAAAVERRRRQLRLTQDDLADLSGTSSRFVRELEAGKATIRLDKLQAVLEALGLRIEIR
jgi:HTH-type transcriptional regulator/antitoxin HipB